MMQSFTIMTAINPHRRGIWADGINVPFNYISGYVGGLISIATDNDSHIFAKKLMQPLQTEEKFQEFPQTWGYWGGEGKNGWEYENGYSINTPNWIGNAAGNNLAHITYRSMDATALLMLHQRYIGSMSNKEVTHFRSLVAKGMLLPQVNEQLKPLGLKVTLNSDVARHFSRSNQAWQIQSQVWALSDLAIEFKRN